MMMGYFIKLGTVFSDKLLLQKLQWTIFLKLNQETLYSY